MPRRIRPAAPRSTRARPRPAKKRSKLVPWRAIKKHNRTREPSSLEKAVYAMLEAEGIPFVREKAIGRLHVDIFLAPNTVIELNGCWFHGHDVCQKTLLRRHRIAHVKDARRIQFLKSRGYEVIVFWECEVRREPERIQTALRSLGLRREGSDEDRIDRGTGPTSHIPVRKRI